MEDELTLDGETGDGDVSRDLNADRLSKRMCDVVLVSGQYRVNAHRLVLATKSSYFRAMFSDGFSEKEMAEVTLTESVEGEILEPLVEYMYVGVITISGTNVQSLLSAANLLDMPKLKAGCWQFLKSHVNASNSLRMWALAMQYSHDDLLKKAFECTLKNFEKVAKQRDFVELIDVRRLIDLLNDYRLVVKNEQIAFEAAMRWVRHRPDERKAHLLEILSSVELARCNGQFLVETVRTDDLIRESDECQRLVDNAIHELLVFFAANHPNLLPNTRRRKPPIETLYTIGGVGFGHALVGGSKVVSVEKYNEHTKTFSIVTQMPGRCCGFGCAVISDRIIIIGSINGDDTSSSVECYEVNSNEWSSLPPLTVARAFFGVAVLDDCIYVVGGHDATKQPLASMERYDPSSNSWTTLPPMPTARAYCEAVVLNKQLYVLGGLTSNLAVIVETFDPQSGVWSTAPPMRTMRRCFGCAVFDGKIFVSGGRGSGGTYLPSVESFNPTDQQWSDHGRLKIARAEHSLAVVNNRLLAIGGFGGRRDEHVKRVEKFQPEKNTWRPLCDLTPAGLFHHCVAVVPNLMP